MEGTDRLGRILLGNSNVRVHNICGYVFSRIRIRKIPIGVR